MTKFPDIREQPTVGDPQRAAAERLFYSGNEHLAAGRRVDALADYHAALLLCPDFGEAALNAGVVLEKEGKLEEARSSYARAVAAMAQSAEARFSLGNVCFKLRRLEDAVTAFGAALVLRPDYPEAWLNLGNVLRLANNLAGAVECYQQVARLRPWAADAHINLANAYRAQNRVIDARVACETALALAPQSPEAHLNYAMTLLVSGELGKAWPHAEYRHAFQLAGAGRVLPVPKWTGEESLEGRSILLHAEQGLGDTLHFVRYVSLVVARGATVHLEVQAPLRALLAASLPEVRVRATGSPLPDVDFHCPLPSLPLAFKTEMATLPRTVPYVWSPTGRKEWAKGVLAGTKGRRIGLAWSGNPTHPNDYNRSVPLADFQSVCAPLAGAHFFSLKKEMTAADAAVLATRPEITSLAAEMEDFADTAALIGELDLVIAVDTSVAHLAGALGRPVWVLLPYSPDWRWLLKREDSPWYPTARLFRQPATDDWASVLRRVRIELEQFCAAAG